MAFEANPFDLQVQPPEPPANEPGSDVAREFTSGLLDTGAQAAGVVGALRRSVSKANVPTAANPTGGPTPEDNRFAGGMEDVQDRLNAASDVVKGAMSPTGKAVSEADWTSGAGLRTKLAHPVQALAQGAAQLAPTLLGATLLPEGWAGVAAGSTFFGTQGVASQMNTTRKRVMDTPDEELQTKTPLYRALREDYDEPTARQKLIEAGNDVKGLLVAGGANALAGGALGHILKGPATSRFLASIGIGSAEAATGLGIAAGGSEAGQQMGEVATGERDSMDPEKIALAALNGGATGALIGAGAGALRGATLPRQVKPTVAERDVTTGRSVQNGEPDPAQGAALDAAQGGTQPPGKGTLAEQIADEEKAPTPAPSPPATPAAPAPPTEPAKPPAIGGQGQEPPVPLPPQRAAPVAPPVEQPVPMPPTDRTNLPPRPKLPTERQAVPLEEPPPGGVTRAEAQDITSTLPQREEPAPQPVQAPPPVVASERVAPTVPAEAAPLIRPAREPAVQSEPVPEHIQALNDAVAQKPKPAEEPAEVTPTADKALEPAELVATTPEGQKIFNVKNELTELVKEARSKERDDVARKQAEADRKRESRFNQQGANEAKAKEAIEASHPRRAEELQDIHAVEQQALSATGGRASAREVLRARAAETLAKAENAGVRIPERTRPTAEQAAAGEKNPTPYTSRLSEIKKFLQLERTAQAVHKRDLPRLEDKLGELYKEHILAERAMRSGDLQGAAERRLEANERLNVRHKAGRVKAEAQRTAEEQAELDQLTREQSDETDARLPKADHYAITSAEGVRHSDVTTELGRLGEEFRPENFSKPEHKARAALLQTFVHKVMERVGNTPMHFIADAAKKAELGFTGEGGRRGVFQFLRAGETEEGHRGEIYIDNDIVHDVHGPQVILHEAVHAATTHAIRQNPRLRADVKAVRSEAERTWTKKMEEAGAHNPLYGFKNEEEFIADALADPRLRNHLTNTPAPPELVARMGLGKGASLWRSLVSSITRALGLGEKHVTLMDAVLHLSDRAMAEEIPWTGVPIKDMRRGTNRVHIAEAEARLYNGSRTAADLTHMVESAPHVGEALRSKIRSLGLKLGTFHNIAQMADSAERFGSGNPVAKLWNAAAKMSHMKGEILEQSGAKKLIGKVAALERKLDPEQMQKFGEFLRDETMAGVFADRPIDQQKGVTSQGKAQHPELATRYSALSADEKSLRRELHAYFKAQQQEAGLATLKAVIRAINPNGEADDALAQKIFDNKLSDAEKRVLDRHHVMRAVRNARTMSKINGPYVPLMRHGDHVVTGNYDVAAPAGGTRLNEEGKPDAKGSVYQFDTKAEAEKFAAGAPVKVTREQHVYVDPQTGERTVVDPATGEKARLTKEDWAANTADEKWRVTLQPKHVEFFESEMEARRRHAELQNHDFGAGVKFTLDGVAPRRYEPTGSNASFLSHEWDRALNSLRQRGGFQALDPNARREMENHLVELSLSSLGSTRIQSRRLPRTFVKGASGDIQKGLGHYASAMSGFLARQRYAPEVDARMKALTDYQEGHKYEPSEKTYPRGQILKELQQRLYASGEPERNSPVDTAIGRLAQMSQLDKLASPAFHIINSMEPWTTSMPVIAGKYGFGKTIAAMHRAYADIGAPTIIGKGLADTARALRSSEGLTDYIKTLSERVLSKPLGKEFSDVLKEMGELGVISRDAGMEVGRMSNPASNVLGRGLDRADVMARQMGTAIESINRFVTARAEYVLARESGLAHEQAKQAAINRTIDTMGDYSKFNAAPIFNSRLGRLALQFKKFAQKTYYILGKTALAGLKGDPEGMKAFAGLMATHGLLAGALGLPLEAIHAGMLAAQLTGLSQNNYGDFEQAVRGIAARNLGAGFGEIATRGLPRYLGVDVSSRFSLADLVFPLGDPASLKPNDLLAYAAKAFGGAPLSLISEYPSGVKALLDGNFVEAQRILVPLKVYADTMTAYQRASVGRVTTSGREKMSPYTPGEAATKALGFAPAREAEAMEAYGAQYGDQQRFKADRSKLMNGFTNAKPDGKAAAWRKIIEWNAQQPPAAKITMGEAERNARRREAEEHNEHVRGGLRTTKRDEHIRQQEQNYVLH